jgi:PST family polysaccharide transporter
VASGIQASVQFTAGVLAIPVIFKQLNVRWYRPSRADLTHAFLEGWPLFLSGAAVYASTSITTVMLGCLAGQTEVGYYSAADKLVRACIAISTPIALTLYPRIAALKVESDASALRAIRKSLGAVGCTMLLVSILTVLLGPRVCSIVFGSSFRPSIEILQLLSPLPFLSGLLAVFGTHTMVVFAMERDFAKIMLLSSLAAAPVSAALMMSYGGAGAAIGTDFQMSVAVCAIVIVLRARDLRVWKNMMPKRVEPAVLTLMSD